MPWPPSPHRAGVNQEIGSSSVVPVTGMKPPASTNCAVSVTAISGST